MNISKTKSTWAIINEDKINNPWKHPGNTQRPAQAKIWPITLLGKTDWEKRIE